MKEKVTEFVLNSPLNTVKELNNLHIWNQPLVGVASANDSLWERLKEPDAVGPQHLSPQEWLQGAASVISYFLPFTEPIRRSNWPDDLPSTEWLYGRYEGAMLNDALRRFIVSLVEGAGGHAVAPALDSRFAVAGLRSNWSERHVAFVAGLGTFSLSRSMITSLGSAGRFGSVIVDTELQPTVRAYRKVDEYCVNCGVCIDRCPPRAISKAGKDNAICSHYVAEMKVKYAPRYGCGKCQTAVPCEGRNPRNHITTGY
ncbi:4Fe-4S binding protein [Sporomusa sp.]|uniref:4Fe-4S binding protein n=1 Tax=Sporomusa sp. TaxID=2078658 RepID=UPI002D7EE28C|nr:4Fe-4S binding protein [Sporomusa sp.]